MCLQESAASDDWWAAGSLVSEATGTQAEGDPLPAHWVVEYTRSGRAYYRNTNTGLSMNEHPGATRTYKWGKWGHWASDDTRSPVLSVGLFRVLSSSFFCAYKVSFARNTLCRTV